MLKDNGISRALVFTRTKHGANSVAEGLARGGIKAEAIHGNKSQDARQRALSDFRNGKVRVLVATDIAARGIDIDGISHVINYDIPNVPESYVHRIGRTARAGAAGVAISFCDGSEKGFLRDIENLTRRKIAVVADHGFPAVHGGGQRPAPDTERGRHQPRGGHRGRSNGHGHGDNRGHGHGQGQRHENSGRAQRTG